MTTPAGRAVPTRPSRRAGTLPFAVGMLAASAVAAAFVSDWFVDGA